MADEEFYYRPCRTGIHVCGANEDKNAALTEASFPVADPVRARELYELAKAEFDCEDGDGDLTVDLFVEDDLVDGFHIRRQMLFRLEAMMKAG